MKRISEEVAGVSASGGSCVHSSEIVERIMEPGTSSRGPASPDLGRNDPPQQPAEPGFTARVDAGLSESITVGTDGAPITYRVEARASVQSGANSNSSIKGGVSSSRPSSCALL